MKIRFIESPTGVFGLAHFVGDEVEMEEKKAKLLTESGFAEAVTLLEDSLPESEVKTAEVKSVTTENNPVLIKKQKGKVKK